MVQCLVWTISICKPEVMRRDPLLKVLAGAAQRRHITTLCHLPEWQALVNEWERPSRQHDVCELITFLRGRWPTLQRLCCGKWEARLMHSGTLQCGDHGGACPLLLTASLQACEEEHLCSMQACIEYWRCQAHIHALTAAPEFLCIQINRFVHKERVCSKCLDPFHAEDQIKFPLYDGRLRTVDVPYVLRACIVHLGQQPDSGHYRSVLWNEFRNMWMCDDAVKKAVDATEDDRALYQRSNFTSTDPKQYGQKYMS